MTRKGYWAEMSMASLARSSSGRQKIAPEWNTGYKATAQR